MFLEEFYNYNAKGDKLIADNMYLHTLTCWLFNNDFQVYENLLDYYEEKEEYAVCEGIHRALAKIDDIMHNRFNDADKIAETTQGKYGLIDIPTVTGKLNVEEPEMMLKEHMKRIERSGKQIDDRCLQNIVDEIATLYYSTIYKLENLL